jgi:hypothetical protein
MSRLVTHHFGVLTAAIACAVGVAAFKCGMPAIAMMIVSCAALWIGDAWDEETR